MSDNGILPYLLADEAAEAVRLAGAQHPTAKAGDRVTVEIGTSSGKRARVILERRKQSRRGFPDYWATIRADWIE